ncbi:MAG: CsiV family protein [Pseudomonadota bacterium]|nr:CsiV family protein [Pseudomonadota bacterium]
MKCKGLVFGLLTLSSLFALPKAQAKQDPEYWRWFEVEVLLFKHTVEQDISEQFPLHLEPIDTSNANDLIAQVVNANHHNLRANLPLCELAEHNWQWNALPCSYEDERLSIEINGSPFNRPSKLSQLVKLPVHFFGPEKDIKDARSPFLVPKSHWVLNETEQTLEQRGLAQPLLHLAWRQPVFGRDDGYKFHLYGGKNFADRYQFNGFMKPQDSVKFAPSTVRNELDPLSQRMQNIEQLFDILAKGQHRFGANEDGQSLAPLQTEPNSKPVWELDGTLHIFLVGNYLHIKGDFNLREEVFIAPPNGDLAAQASTLLTSTQNQTEEERFLRSYRFDQLRRVISHETHYFDHPKLGMIVQIRRTDLSARRY